MMETNTDHTVRNTSLFVIAFMVAFGLLLIVLAAIATNALTMLIAGVVVLGLILIGLSTIGVRLFVKFSDAKLKIDQEQNRHVEAMADMGLLPRGGRYEPALLDEPEDLPVSLSGEVDSTVDAYRNDAIELLALSCLEMPMKRDSQQIIPYYKARKNPYFEDVGTWMNAVKYMLIKQMVYQKRRKGRSGWKNIGTFLNSGTVGVALDSLKRGA